MDAFDECENVPVLIIIFSLFLFFLSLHLSSSPYLSIHLSIYLSLLIWSVELGKDGMGSNDMVSNYK